MKIARTVRSATILILILTASVTAKEQFTDEQVRQAIVRESVAQYHSTGHPCACPYDLARNGSSCGGRSAYSRPGGAEPLCYSTDVTPPMVQEWRAHH
jgi:hypothetical protein